MASTVEIGSEEGSKNASSVSRTGWHFEDGLPRDEALGAHRSVTALRGRDNLAQLVLLEKRGEVKVGKPRLVAPMSYKYGQGSNVGGPERSSV